MKNKIICCFLMLLFFQHSFGQKSSEGFEVYSQNKVASILYDKNGSSLDSISALLLAEDIQNVTGKKPLIIHKQNDINGNTIVIGGIGSDLINHFLEEKFPENFKNQKESYFHKIVTAKPSKSGKSLIIAGTDPRGTAYGVLDISEKIGVSPWYFWADVPVEKREEVIIEQTDFYSKEPSVEFRGIFLNDEDWGLQPWAENTFEPEVGDIGPKTYAKIFELLLRLKANTIWPAMHPSTKAFFYYPGNPEMAKKYHIIVGSSHAEPMLRNNVDEWDKNTHGDFNYISNKQSVYDYWEGRVKETADQDAIYTLGMRGIHDSGMEGAKNTEEGANVLQQVIQDQRDLLQKYNDGELSQIPQTFTVYKEVLELYDYGLSLPEDITITWTDDNYGYIRRLSNKEERLRAGGGGVYYHVSYWGRPHDYQWLSTTHPGLIREEMYKAYETNSKKLWILNVGDIKPAEYHIQLFMDMAYGIDNFKDPENVQEHMKSFYSSIFGKEVAGEISDLKLKFYDLAFERKPEFMGWSQTEPTTPIDTTAYNPYSWGDEISSRINNYDKLEKLAEHIKKKVDSPAQDAYFQLVYYPVKGASFMNKKFLYRDLAIKYAKQKRLVAKEYKELSLTYFDSINFITRQYNSEISGGKWNGIMDMAPRELPVFEKPEILFELNDLGSEVAGISVENIEKGDKNSLPAFYENADKDHFFDIYLKNSGTVDWSIADNPSWLKLSKTRGSLKSEGMAAQQRVEVGIDWEKWRRAKKIQEGSFTVKIGEQENELQVKTKFNPAPESGKHIFTEQNGLVTIYAEDYSEKKDADNIYWQKIPKLGYSGALMKAAPVTGNPLDTLKLKEHSPFLQYTLYTSSISDSAELIINALPTHPVTNEHSLRVGVQWNEEPIEIVDFRTYGRSETWKQNVLKNLASESLVVPVKKTGKQVLKLYMIDQGVYLDFIYLKLKEQNLPYRP